MNASSNRQWILKSRPQGMVGEENFERRDAAIPEVADGKILVKNLLLSFDPTLRIYMSVDSYVPKVPLGEVMRAFGVGQVIASKHPKFKVGQLVFATVGWQDYALLDLSDPNFPVTALPGFLDPALAISLALTGTTAYFGLLKVGRPKPGETVVVSGAAGATGSIAAQIAKIKGCRTIGIAGGKEKCDWLTRELKLDGAIDYKNDDVPARLIELCPKGVDVYFDNVGGELTDHVLPCLALRGRVVLCGGISQYNFVTDAGIRPEAYLWKNLSELISKRIRIEGFIVLDYLPRALEALISLTHWVKQGKLVQAVDMQEGFDNIPKTLTRLFTGENKGKQLLKLAEPSLEVPKDRLQEALFRSAQAVRGLFGG